MDKEKVIGGSTGNPFSKINLDVSGVHSAPSIKVEPHVTLKNWRIMEDLDGHRYFAGNQGWRGRASTAIVKYDPTTQIGVTASGRIYKLEGDEVKKLDNDAQFVWNHYVKINNLTIMNK